MEPAVRPPPWPPAAAGWAAASWAAASWAAASWAAAGWAAGEEYRTSFRAGYRYRRQARRSGWFVVVVAATAATTWSEPSPARVGGAAH
ncbi:hypothetical protein BC937DRAFT_94734 [Endogone sp. FLAS-F59071]|nr:hypothetical protein BC937DRAFT_94734 [Endogone sp. FLAS-F59071]|eukprot:RUS20642.1 hypothetical protein BC937DRAFT_94734 [Endogone sp. FLAS-F59071]